MNCFSAEFNPYYAEFLEPSIFGTAQYQFRDIKMVSQQYRAWSDCMDVKASLALYWWQRLITFGVGRIRVNKHTCLLYNFRNGSIDTKMIVNSIEPVKLLGCAG